MADIWHQFGADLQAGVTGDLAGADGALLGQQRVLRRLLTNPGDYLWQPLYGAGLARFVGAPVDPARIRGVIRGQIFREAAVARSPEPQIDVQAAGDGSVYVTIRYTDAPSGGTQTLRFSIGGQT